MTTARDLANLVTAILDSDARAAVIKYRNALRDNPQTMIVFWLSTNRALIIPAASLVNLIEWHID